MKEWIWGYGYRLNYFGEISDTNLDDETYTNWPASLFYEESLACQREGVRRGETDIPVSMV